MTDLPSYWLEHIGESYIDLDNPENLDHTLVLEHSNADDEENDTTWNKTNGNKVFSRRVLLGVTEAVNVGGKLWSRSNNEQSTGNLNALVFHQYANALGTGWDIIDYETHCKIAHLFYAKYGNRDVQGQIGAGQNSYMKIIGTTHTLGNKDGADTNNVSFLGIENAWGCKSEWVSGVHSNGSIYYIYDGYQPDQVPAGQYRIINAGDNFPYSGGTISKVFQGKYGDMIPIEFKGYINGKREYYKDEGSAGYSTWSIGRRSKPLSNNTGSGVVSFSFNATPKYAYEYIGSRIQYRGPITVIDNPQEFIALPLNF